MPLVKTTIHFQQFLLSNYTKQTEFCIIATTPTFIKTVNIVQTQWVHLNGQRNIIQNAHVREQSRIYGIRNAFTSFIQSRQKRVVWYPFSSPWLAGYEILAFEKPCLHYHKISTESQLLCTWSKWKQTNRKHATIYGIFSQNFRT